LIQHFMSARCDCKAKLLLPVQSCAGRAKFVIKSEHGYETIKRFRKLARMEQSIDIPQPNQPVYDGCISIARWTFVKEPIWSTCSSHELD